MIGSGTDSVLKISMYVDSGAKGSLSVKKLDHWSLSYQIYFSTNKDLLRFVDEYFPDSINSDIRKKIKRGIKFSVESYD